MPKPTFLQSVLRKPTRSYADPYAASPWADHDDDVQSSSSRYSPDSGYGVDRRAWEGGYEAGPSRPKSRGTASNLSLANGTVPRTRGPSSTVSTSAMSDGPSLSSRFPKPARKVASSVALRDGEIVHLGSDGKESVTSTPRRKKKKDKSLPSSPLSATSSRPTSPPLSATQTAVKRTGTKKKKKAPSSVDQAETGSMLSTITSSSTLSRPPPVLSRYSETSSSAASSPGTPQSPIQSTHVAQLPVRSNQTQSKVNIASRPAAPRPLLTPPSSEMSTPNSSSQSVRPLALTTIPQPLPVAKSKVNSYSTLSVPPNDRAETDSEDEVFYTPRSSLEIQPKTPIHDSAMPRPPMVQVEVNETVTAVVPPPSFNFLPPTPAPIPDPPTSPFHHIVIADAQSLYPDRPPTRPTSPSADPQHLNSSSHMSRQATEPEEDAQSASGQVGSDDEDDLEPEPSYQSARRASVAPSAASSRRDRSQAPPLPVRSVGTPASSVDGRRSASRQSSTRHKAQKSFDDFLVRHRRPSRPASEASFGEGSMRGSVSGYGKGGWAAAAASANGGRSGAASPMMYMPTGGDGWGEFQQPPPRQSRFTPLPASSHPPTFDRLVNGNRMGSSLPGTSTPTSYSGLQPPSRGDSSPSEYSQLSDGLPMPSRSYLIKDHSNESSRTASEIDGLQDADGLHHSDENPSRQPPILGSIPFPQARIQSPVFDRPLSPPHRSASRATTRPISPRPLSPVPYHPSGSPVLGGQSPNPSRPASRAGFEPPSFLDPDLLTILPEMSNEDSDRLYRPSRSESGWGRKTPVQDGVSRRSSMFKARSEVGLSRHGQSDDEVDEVPELPQPTVRRSKSVIGHRQSGESHKWEGSSYGDGVLMESHGRTQESVGGYTNLVLPSGAYRPSNPAKTASELDSRILGLPHATMASITLNSTSQRFAQTPQHLRSNLPSLVDFSSHLKPPAKVGNAQLLIQVYAVAVDPLDVRALDEKGKGDIGKWVPGRSFVGRCLAVGADEKEVVRGDIVMGLVDVRKSGALSEYILADRRRVSRAPFPTQLTLEQLSLLPLQGIAVARAVRTHLVRRSRALISGADSGLAALVCQELSRAGVQVTAVIPGGDNSHQAHTRCLDNGARGVLMGSLAAVMLNLDEGGWDLIFDDKGGQRVYDAARKLLKDGGKLVSTVRPEHSFSSAPPHLTSRPSGLKTLRAAFGSRRKESKFTSFEYISNAGSGEPEVDSSGMDFRDVMEEGCMAIFRPVLEATHSAQGGMGMNSEGITRELDVVIPFEKGPEVFRSGVWEGVRVIRLIN